MIYPVALDIGTSSQAVGVKVPDLPTCYSAGNTVEEALKNVAVAIAMHLEGLIAEGGVAPFGSSVSRYMGIEEFEGCVWALVNVNSNEYFGDNEKINITLPSVLIEKIDKYICGNQDFRSRSEFLVIGAELILGSENSTINLEKCEKK